MFDYFGVPLKPNDLTLHYNGALYRVSRRTNDGLGIIAYAGVHDNHKGIVLYPKNIVNYCAYDMHFSAYTSNNILPKQYKDYKRGDVIIKSKDFSLVHVGAKNADVFGYFLQFTEQYRWNIQNYPELFI